MKNKNIKKYTIILLMLIITGLCSVGVSAQDTSSGGDGSGGGSSTGDDPTTNTSILIFVEVLKTYCDNNAGFGKVRFTSEPYDGAMFQISGTYPSGTSVAYTFHPGEHTLPAGIYAWNAIATSLAAGNPEPSTGEFVISIECDDTNNDTIDYPDDSIDDVTTPSDDSSSDGITDENTDTGTATAPNPPAVFDVLRQEDTTFILFNWDNISAFDISHFLLYRRSETSNWNWKMVSKIPLSECVEYTCSHWVIEDNLNDGREYAVSAVDSAGHEGPKTPSKRPQEDGDSSGGQPSGIDEEAADTTSGSGIYDEGKTEPAIATDGDFVTSDASIIRSVLSGTHVLFLETEYADLIEWYIKREPGDIYKYLGAATFNKENGRWEYVWDTTQVPNGDYVLVPKIKSDTGKVYKHTPSYITIKNEKIDDNTSTEDTTLVNEAKEAASQIAVIEKEEEEEQAKENIVGVTTPYYDKVQKYLENNQDDTLQKRKFIEKQQQEEEYLRRLLDIESSRLLGSILDGDEDRRKRIREKIIMASDDSLLRIDAFARELGIELDEDEMKLIQEERRVLLAEFERIVEKKKEALHGHVEENIFNDSDKDGISDYDEINTYDTNPLNADSDNDGYIDGAEILGGFNPKDASVEAVIRYEEPTTAGYVEEEMISIDSVSTAEIKIDEEGEARAKKISFQGTAPPRSFVTLYIYSTPIIVTVKTDSRGNWNYVLDKELEDGNHEIYVAITDNSGKIFAKSKPLPFVKEAAAVTINENALLGGDDTSLSIFDRRYLYITVLLIVVIIGWVLIFTGSKRTALEEQINNK